jgi:hypothetical protein
MKKEIKDQLGKNLDVKNVFDNQGELIAQIYNIKEMNSSCFPTPEHFTFQFGYGQVSDEKELRPHIHKKLSRELTNTAEFIFVIDGSMFINVLDEGANEIASVTLKSDMCLLQHKGGHKISIAKNTRYFEIKQGPYFGNDRDKYFLD